MSESIGDKRYGCPECQAGVLHLEYIPYFMMQNTWLSCRVFLPGSAIYAVGGSMTPEPFNGWIF